MRIGCFHTQQTATDLHVSEAAPDEECSTTVI